MATARRTRSKDKVTATLQAVADGVVAGRAAAELADPAVMESLDRFWKTVNAIPPSEAGRELLTRAVEFAAEFHAGVRRKSGEPYLIHPLEVATILARMRLDAETIAGALLHDLVEDTPVTAEDIEAAFGSRVHHLVEGVTKLGKIRLPDEPDRAVREREAHAESLRRMVLAMIDDIGVVLIKLADRLHNMRTLKHLAAEKQLGIARETLEIYAPLANRLGLWPIKSELEDLSFMYLHPLDYQRIKTQVERRGRDQARYIELVKRTLGDELAARGIAAELTGRTKHVYSIFRKMQRKDRQFEEIYDLIGIRVLVDSKADCYAALGYVHELWHPIPGEVDDYIATPKDSMYQSLHTAVVGPDGHHLEIQIRTREMHEVSENGVAAHWRYKEGGKGDARADARIEWVRQLLSFREDSSDPEEFVDYLKADLFREQIFVFTPKGEVIPLPHGSTPIDFAYRIHTEVGHHCVRAIVNGQMVRLDYQLKSGQTVQIQTSKQKEGPSRDWLMEGSGYVKTAGAREKIRQWFKRQHRDESIAQGREILDRELRQLSVDMKFEDVLKHYPNYQKLDDFLVGIGNGTVSSQSIASRLGESDAGDYLLAPTTAPQLTSPQRVRISGAEGMLTTIAPCCKPVPGEPISGFVTRGRGVTVHRADCPNVVKSPEQERLVAVSWDGRDRQDMFAVSLTILAWDRVGLLRDVSALLADEEVNIIYINTQTDEKREVRIDCTVEVRDVKQLSALIHRLQGVQDVRDVRRTSSGGYSSQKPQA